VVSATGRRLKLAPSARLRWDKIESRHVLLSPERGLSLGATATEIVQLCDGTLTASGIVERCVARYGQGDRAKIEADVHGMLKELLSRGLIVEEAAEEGEEERAG
jgi:pyrroloquinoline quinone biosynthesis protein D